MTTINRVAKNVFVIGLLTLPVLLLLILLVRTSSQQASANVEQIADSDDVVELSRLSLPFKYFLLSLKEPDEQLLMPVKGVRVRSVANTWGAARDGGRAHAGQDIFARRGTPVYSATPGFVWHVGESLRGGKVVFIIGAGGRRYYYAHLDKHAESLAEGDEVTTETLLGYVGTTGNARGTPPHLHFGIYAMTGAINPLPLLADRG